MKTLEAKDAALTLEVRSSRAEAKQHEALLKAAQERCDAATTERDSVRKHKTDLQAVFDEFRSVAQRAAELLHKKQ